MMAKLREKIYNNRDSTLQNKGVRDWWNQGLKKLQSLLLIQMLSVELFQNLWPKSILLKFYILGLKKE